MLGEGRTVLYGIEVCVKWGVGRVHKWPSGLFVTTHTAGFF